MSQGEKFILNAAEKHISDDKKICTIFNNFFSNVVSDLKMGKWVTTVIIFPKKHILSQLSLKHLKNTPIFLILKEES